MDTIALIASYSALLIATFYYKQIELSGILVGLFGLVMVGEYFSLKRTRKTISKRFVREMPKIKWTITTLIGFAVASLIWHLQVF